MEQITDNREDAQGTLDKDCCWLLVVAKGLLLLLKLIVMMLNLMIV